MGRSRHPAGVPRKPRGKRGPDRGNGRAQRTCQRCLKYGGSNASACKGRAVNGTCQNFNEVGLPQDLDLDVVAEQLAQEQSFDETLAEGGDGSRLVDDPSLPHMYAA